MLAGVVYLFCQCVGCQRHLCSQHNPGLHCRIPIMLLPKEMLPSSGFKYWLQILDLNTGLYGQGKGNQPAHKQRPHFNFIGSLPFCTIILKASIVLCTHGSHCCAVSMQTGISCCSWQHCTWITQRQVLEDLLGARGQQDKKNYTVKSDGCIGSRGLVQ